MAKFRKKPVTIEAEQYHRERHIKEGYLPDGVERRFGVGEDGAEYETLPVIVTLEGEMTVSDGDWVITGIAGERYPCKDAIFKATYEAANESPESKDKIHEWFELSYAQYLTIPRSVLQSMPDSWQEQFVELLRQLDSTIDWRPKKGCYRVMLCEVDEAWDEKEQRHVEAWGKELDDPLMDYERGRRRVPFRSEGEG